MPAATSENPVSQSARSHVAEPYTLDKSLTIPKMEPFGTTFGVELEMRPAGYLGNNFDCHGTNWNALCQRVIQAGLIDPAKSAKFTELCPEGRTLGQWHSLSGMPHGLPTCNGSIFWNRICAFFRPEILAGLQGLHDASDAGGDELKTPVLREAAHTEVFFRALYTVLPHFYDFNNVAGCGMHIHVGRGELEQTKAFERFMISREWMFQLMVPQYRRHGYNKVWRTDTLAALIARRAISESYSSHLRVSSPLHPVGINTNQTFDGDIQSAFNPPNSRSFGILTSGMVSVSALQVPLAPTHGHWICGGRYRTTTEFRLFAPPAHPRDVINWIRLLNHIWLFAKNEPAKAALRSDITPFLAAETVRLLFNEECGGLPADLFQWIHEKYTQHSN